MKNLIELYKSILSSVGMTSDSQGFISTLTPGSDTPKPWTVEGKRGVLPTPEQLKQPDWSGRIGFHPLLQNLSGGESRVLEKFRDRMNGNSDFVLGMLMIDIAQLGVKGEIHKDLTPEQATYLGPFSDSDEKFVKLLRDLTSTKRVVKKNFEFIRFSVIKGRAWQGQKRSRVAVAHFPLYEALPKDNKPVQVGNFKLRIVDVKMLRNMYEFLFPGIRENGYYEIGSDSKIAPSLESLMALYGKFVDAINTAVAILEPVLNTSNALLLVDDWRDEMADLTPLLPEIRNIPYLEGNAPSERVAAAAAPARISDTPIAAAARTVVAADVAPTITADMVQPVEPVQQSQPIQHQEAQVVQQSGQPQPRFKLGMKSLTVTAENATHQISDQAASQVSGLSYARPAPVVGTVTPTPPVGTLIQPQQPVFQQPQQQQPAAPQAMKVPESARIINNQLYIPVEGSGVSGIPQGAVMVDNKVYVPLAGVQQGGQVLPGQQAQFGQPQGRFGQPAQITDPSQIPGLSAEEVQFYRMNPVMFQHFLQNLQQNNMQAAQVQLNQRQQSVPRYLQNAVQQAQQEQLATRGFFRR
ncbi:hypothetical protein [Ralstonia phage RP12]|uniref:Uncharacterized protein n=1 Tax=Ralstonia phage RP12 TaxID=1923889 RepID=A0A1L7N188_9CAUD|nr:hypothetical protein FDH28_gp144 [Ralstonia phage RP12]BAW19251.1 hypothetical protein [Ralstonia phage RP12]